MTKFFAAAIAALGLAATALPMAASAQQYPYPQYPQQYGEYGQNGYAPCGNGYGYNRGYDQQRRRDGDDNGDRDDNNGNGYYNNGNGNGHGYGRYGRYGGYGRNNNLCGNAEVDGTIVRVDGNLVTINRGQYGNGQYGNGQYGNGQYGYGRYGQYPYGGYGQNNPYGRQYGNTIRIDDQPALDNRTSGRVAVGRYVRAFGYWANGVFYATTME